MRTKDCFFTSTHKHTPQPKRVKCKFYTKVKISVKIFQYFEAQLSKYFVLHASLLHPAIKQMSFHLIYKLTNTNTYFARFHFARTFYEKKLSKSCRRGLQSPVTFVRKQIHQKYDIRKLKYCTLICTTILKALEV